MTDKLDGHSMNFVIVNNGYARIVFPKRFTKGKLGGGI